MSTGSRSQPRVLGGEQATLPLMLRAALPAVPGVNQLPGIRRSGGDLPDLAVTRHDVPIDRDRVAAYSQVCGFPVKESLPLTYPHVLAFPLHMTLMTDPSFPFPAIGTVHVENAITQHRAITAEERLQLTARTGDLRPHPKGRTFTITTSVHSGGEPVWESTSTFLRRGGDDRSTAGAQRMFEEVPASGISWQLPGDLGRSYAAVSGDHNPIHLYGLTAKVFGFPRQIAHGMWSKARCLAALDGRLPDAVTAEVAFRKPILLPGRVDFGSRTVGDGYAFSLTRPKDGAPHLLGRVGPAT
jgi:hypothetical protein